MKHPTSEAELFDYLHEKFGIGHYDDIAANSREWWRERGTGIAKLKAMLKRRHQHIDDVVIAADYAARHKKVIKYYPQVFELIAEAKRERRDIANETRRVRVHNQLWEAARDAWEAGEDEWGERLARASVDEAQTVLDEWREHRG